jgi:hypothetical protein
VANIIQIRRDVASTWTSVNPTLAIGEIGLETDTAKIKIGTGSTTWTSLSYWTLGTSGFAPTANPTFTGAVNASGTLQLAGTAITSTAAELNYVDGVTSNIQTQLNAKAVLASPAFTGTVTSTGMTINGDLTVNGSANIEEVKEDLALDTTTTGTINFDAKSGSIIYYTANQTANRTINFRGDGSTTMNTFLAVGESTTLTAIVTNGASAKYLNVYQVDGTAVTPKWSTGTAPTAGNASAIDVYSFTVIKTASAAYTVLASFAKFA